MQQEASEIIKKYIRIGKVKTSMLIFTVLFAAAFVSVVAVIYNEIFLMGTELARKRFEYSPLLGFILIPLFFLISAWLCRTYAPNAAGSGPEHVISSLKKLSHHGSEKADVSEYLSVRIILIKAISSLICIAGGGALGREGPVIQIAASIFSVVALKMKRFLPPFDMRTWIIAGSAAGLAAAFNTPLAGLVFAIEELARFHVEPRRLGLKIKIFFSVIVSGVLAQMLTGTYVLFEFVTIPFAWKFRTIVLVLLVAVTCGILAALLKVGLDKAATFRDSIKSDSWYFIPLGMGLVVALISYFGGYNTFGAGFFSVHDAFTSSNAVLSANDLFGRFFNTIASAASGCAGGLLLPALALGGGVGSVASHLLPLMDARIFVAAGMAAFMGSLLNAPITAAVLVLEMTNQRELILPLFLATLTASWIFKNCCKVGGH